MSGTRSTLKKPYGVSHFYGQTQSHNYLQQQHQKKEEIETSQQQQFQQQIGFNPSEILSELLILVRKIDSEVREIREVLHMKEGRSTVSKESVMGLRRRSQTAITVENGQTSKKNQEEYQGLKEISKKHISQQVKQNELSRTKQYEMNLLPPKDDNFIEHHRKYKTEETQDYQNPNNNNDSHYLDISPIHRTSAFSNTSEDPIILMDFFKRDGFIQVQSFPLAEEEEGKQERQRHQMFENSKNSTAAESKSSNKQHLEEEVYEDSHFNSNKCQQQVFQEKQKKRRTQSGEDLQSKRFKENYGSQIENSSRNYQKNEQHGKRNFYDENRISNENNLEDKRWSNSNSKSNQINLERRTSSHRSQSQLLSEQSIKNQQQSQQYQSTNRMNNLSSSTKSSHKRTNTENISSFHKQSERDSKQQQQKKKLDQQSSTKFNHNLTEQQSLNYLLDNKENIDSGRLISLKSLNNYHLQQQKKHPEKLNFYSQTQDESNSFLYRSNSNGISSSKQSPSSQAIIKKQTKNTNNQLNCPHSTAFHSTRLRN